MSRPSRVVSDGQDYMDTVANRVRVAVVIPCYNEARSIQGVVKGLPTWITSIVVVDDASQDETAAVVRDIAENDRRVVLVQSDRNEGVGGATVRGFRRAIDLRADIIVKMDGDGQMNAEYLPRLLEPLIDGRADYAKGNRFHDFEALHQMPVVRRIGNLVLGFLAKAATGYWDCFDPTNGFLAVRREVLSSLPLETIDKSYFFEQSMLAHLYLMGAVVEDVCMPSLYNDEGSSLSIAKALFEFPWRMALSLARRLLLKNFIYDFTMESVYILAGIPMLLTGVTYGGVSWVTYASKGVPAPTGTVVIPAMLIILGFQLLLAAVNLDLASVPQQPLTAPLALGDPPRAPADPLRRGGTEETPANGGAELGTTRKGGNGVD